MQKISLSDLFLRAVLPSIINALREVLDEADALSYADLFLLCQLGGQTGLTRRGMVHGHVSLLLVADKETQKMRQQQQKKPSYPPVSAHCGYTKWSDWSDKVKNEAAVWSGFLNQFVYSGILTGGHRSHTKTGDTSTSSAVQ